LQAHFAIFQQSRSQVSTPNPFSIADSITLASAMVLWFHCLCPF